MHARASRHRTDVAVYRRFVPLLKPSWFPLAVALAASACTPLLFAARIWLLKVLIDTALRGHRPDLLVAVAGGFVVIAVARRACPRGAAAPVRVAGLGAGRCRRPDRTAPRAGRVRVLVAVGRVLVVGPRRGRRRRRARVVV